MKSADTNILVRVIMKDDAVQTPLAAEAFRRPLFVSHGVIMETEWVLRSRYNLPREEIAAVLRRLLFEVDMVETVEPESIAWSLDRYSAGADLADMLHIVASRGFEAFLTFETKLAEIAGPDTPIAIERLS